MSGKTCWTGNNCFDRNIMVTYHCHSWSVRADDVKCPASSPHFKSRLDSFRYFLSDIIVVGILTFLWKLSPDQITTSPPALLLHRIVYITLYRRILTLLWVSLYLLSVLLVLMALVMRLSIHLVHDLVHELMAVPTLQMQPEFLLCWCIGRCNYIYEINWPYWLQFLYKITPKNWQSNS